MREELKVRSLGRENPLEKEMATRSSILAWRISDRGAWRATVHAVPESRTQLSTHTHAHTENSQGNLMCGSSQSILKETSPEYSLEGLMLKLKLQNFGHLMRRTDWKRPWCCERLTAGGQGGDRGWDGWMASPTRWTWVWASSRSWWWSGRKDSLFNKWCWEK